MARPIKTRISGTGYRDDRAGKAAVQRLKYSRYNKDTKTHEIDIDRIRAIIAEYIRQNEYITEIDKDGNETVIPGKLSRVALRQALNISRDTYTTYLQGYVSRPDIDDITVQPNTELADALRAGDDRIIQYLVEQSGKYDQTKAIRLLETYGELTPQKQIIDNNIRTGKWSKWGK